jgi:ferrous iron transport protein B
VESIYTDAHQIASRSVTLPSSKPTFDLDRTLDKLLTSRWTGFPLMFLMLAVVFWLTVEGANVPSALLASILGRYDPPLAARDLFMPPVRRGGSPVWRWTVSGSRWRGSSA